MKFELKDKIALVTGASSGIGREVALALAEKGAKVALVARNVQSLTKVKQQLNEKGKIVSLDEFVGISEEERKALPDPIDFFAPPAAPPASAPAPVKEKEEKSGKLKYIIIGVVTTGGVVILLIKFFKPDVPRAGGYDSLYGED